MRTNRVLIVDDEKDVTLLFNQKFRNELNSGTIDFVFCHTGEDALDYFKNESIELCLVLSDIKMPGMSGLKLLEEIKGENPETKVVMVSAYGDDYTRTKATELGADGFVEKPVEFKDLKTLIKQYVDE